MTASNDRTTGATRANAAQKAATTHDAAMQIIDDETAAREKKTERLRRLRLEREAAETAAPDPAPRRKLKRK